VTVVRFVDDTSEKQGYNPHFDVLIQVDSSQQERAIAEYKKIVERKRDSAAAYTFISTKHFTPQDIGSRVVRHSFECSALTEQVQACPSFRNVFSSRCCGAFSVGPPRQQWPANMSLVAGLPSTASRKTLSIRFFKPEMVTCG